MLDCTTSMSSYLYDIQVHIASLVQAVDKLHPDSNLRLAFVGYHHVLNEDEKHKIFIQRFTKDVSDFRTVLSKMYTSGGGYDFLADVTGEGFIDVNDSLISVSNSKRH